MTAKLNKQSELCNAILVVSLPWRVPLRLLGRWSDTPIQKLARILGPRDSAACFFNGKTCSNFRCGYATMLQTSSKLKSASLSTSEKECHSDKLFREASCSHSQWPLQPSLQVPKGARLQLLESRSAYYWLRTIRRYASAAHFFIVAVWRLSSTSAHHSTKAGAAAARASKKNVQKHK